MHRFQSYVERNDPNTVSVREVELAFPLSSSLLSAVDCALAEEKDAPAGAATSAAAAAAIAAPAETSSSSTTPVPEQQPPPKLLQQNSLIRRTARCMLPKLDESYIGELLCS